MKEHKSIFRNLVDRLMSRWVSDSHSEEFLGDLQEMYDDRRSTRGRLVAELMYCFDALHLLIGFSSTGVNKNNSHTMFLGNMLKISWRNALRQKQFTFLNLAGLTLGIATCVAIGLYVYDETTYDTFHPNGDRIYRVNQPLIWGDWNTPFASTGPGVAEALKSEIPDFEQVSRILSVGEKTVRVSVGEKTTLYTERKFFYAEDNFLEVFQFPFVAGTALTALDEPNSVVLSLTTAQKYFGGDEAIGKAIEIKQDDGTYQSYLVKGVLADLPTKSHLQFDVLGSLSSIPQMKENSWKWIWTGFSTYVMVREGTDLAALRAKLQSIPPKWAASTTKNIFNQTFDEFTSGKQWTLYLQPVREIYLASDPANHRFGPSGNPQFVIIFSVIGLLVLALSCINFMNLSTARSSNRAKEVGVRKALGSEKSILVKQFIVESTAYVAIATIVALLIVQLSLSAFNMMADRQLKLLPHFSNPIFIGILLIFILLLGVAAGSYPAFYLSAFKPAETLKGNIKSGMRNKGIRNGLVVFQFTVSIALIICTIFVQKQLSYTRSMDVGMAKDNILQIHSMEQLSTDVNVLAEKLKTNSAFSNVAKSNSLPPYVWDGDRYHADGPDQPVIEMNYLRADENYLPLLKSEFIAGRNFDPANPNDKYKLIINEEAAKALGLGTRDTWQGNSPIGKFVVQAFGNEDKLEIIGVVKDFNFNSVKQQILPLLIMHEENDLHWSYFQRRVFLSMRLNPASVESPGQLQSIIDAVRSEVANADPSVIFQYSFMDEEFENTFRSEQRLSAVLNLFTGLAITIACLGLFGLAAFSAEQRKKELGIRKLHGASVSQLIITFSAEFTKLVLIGVLLAAPIAWYMTDFWLSSFANRTPMNLWVFALAGLGAVSVALITVGYQSYAVANNNPVEALKSE
jgi:putative ABC transport system permease protein